jgi:hypothetical protein
MTLQRRQYQLTNGLLMLVQSRQLLVMLSLMALLIKLLRKMLFTMLWLLNLTKQAKVLRAELQSLTVAERFPQDNFLR